jgi:hypothetical protein
VTPDKGPARPVEGGEPDGDAGSGAGAIVPRVTVGGPLTNAQGRTVELAGAPACALVEGLGNLTGREAWWGPHVWAEDRRAARNWRSACAVVLDVDCDGHAPLGGELAARAIESLREWATLAHATPHGLRVVLLLAKPTADPELFQRAARGAEVLVAAALQRGGIEGLAVDPSCTADLARVFLGPKAWAKGEQRSADVVRLRAEPWAIEGLAQHAPDETVAPRTGAAPPGGPVPEGQRRRELLRIAGALQRQGAGMGAIAAAVHAANRERCRPPMPEVEVEALARDVANRYAAAKVPAQARRTPIVSPAPAWDPPPLGAFPRTLRLFIDEGAPAVGANPAALMLGVLAALAGAVGLSRDVPLKRRWHEPPILWLGLVAHASAKKSPIFQLAMDPLDALDGRLQEAHALERERHAEDLEAWKGLAKSVRAQVSPPPPPVERRRMVDDVTIERVARLLATNPRGLLLAPEELAVWLRSFGEYKGGAGGDAARWLRCYGGRSLRVDRVGAGSIFIPRAAVSIFGTVQPGTLARILTDELLDAGHGSRLWLVAPPPGPPGWDDADVSESALEGYCRLIEGLAALEPEPLERGRVRPRGLVPTPEGLAIFKAWSLTVGREAQREGSADASVSMKAEGGAARLACLLALARAAEHGRAEALQVIEAEDMAGGVAVAAWLRARTHDVLGALAEPREVRELRELAAVVARAGGRLTPRELARGARKFRGPGAAEDALGRLVDAGLARWEWKPPASAGGGPSREAVLVGDESPPQAPIIGGCDTVAGVAAPEDEADREAWLERLAIQAEGEA